MRTTIQYIERELKSLYPKTEILAFARIIIGKVCGWDFTEQILKKEEIISDEKVETIKKMVSRLKHFEPVQYIVGETEFYGLKLKVNPSVLIPRQETEEMVHWMIQSNFGDVKILDIGTGSGCIALALKKTIENAEVSGIDISEKALEFARCNAAENNLDVNFLLADILNWEKFTWKKYNVIVSNPPYVRISEKQKMEDNVLKYEPSNALFVPDEDPLIFYRKIAAFSKEYLVEGGKLFFEINENLGKEMMNLVKEFGFSDIQIRKDLNEKNRMLCAQK